MELPVFKYHPAPLETGAIVESDDECECCGKSRGHMYDGPIYGEDEYEFICPWCIADGSANKELGAEFTDAASVGGGGTWEDVEEDIVEVVANCTPGFYGWQQEQWATCCDDACAFLGRAGWKELTQRWPEAIESVQANCGLDGKEWDAFFKKMDAAGSPTAYVFQCLHCKKLHAYQDCD